MSGVSVGSLDSRVGNGVGLGSSHQSQRALASSSVCELCALLTKSAGAAIILCVEWNESVVCHSLLLDRLDVPPALFCLSPLEEDALALTCLPLMAVVSSVCLSLCSRGVPASQADCLSLLG